jgi:hypothetical protein
LFGYYLVEYEGTSASRADLCDKALIDEVSAALASQGIKGLSPSIVEARVSPGPPHRTQHADFPHYALLLPSHHCCHKGVSRSQLHQAKLLVEMRIP